MQTKLIALAVAGSVSAINIHDLNEHLLAVENMQQNHVRQIEDALAAQDAPAGQATQAGQPDAQNISPEVVSCLNKLQTIQASFPTPVPALAEGLNSLEGECDISVPASLSSDYQKYTAAASSWADQVRSELTDCPGYTEALNQLPTACAEQGSAAPTADAGKVTTAPVADSEPAVPTAPGAAVPTEALAGVLGNNGSSEAPKELQSGLAGLEGEEGPEDGEGGKNKIALPHGHGEGVPQIPTGVVGPGAGHPGGEPLGPGVAQHTGGGHGGFGGDNHTVVMAGASRRNGAIMAVVAAVGFAVFAL